MANYTYKNVCYDVPQKYIEEFEEKHGREFDDDPNYNGDYWIVVGNWIKDLLSENEQLRKQLAEQKSAN